MEYMIMPFKRYFDFKGRSRRMEFWMFSLFLMIVYLVLGGLIFGLGGAGTAMDAATDADNPLAIYGMLFSGVGGILLAIFVLAVFIPSIAVGVRRLHDRDMSGWWYLGFIVGSLIPFVGLIVSIAFLVLMVLPGTDGPNRFGPDPKNPTRADIFE